MPVVASQVIIIANLARKADAQRAQLDDAWRSLRAAAARNAVVKTMNVALAVAQAAPVLAALFRLCCGSCTLPHQFAKRGG
jgi:hypothetical protein